MELERDDEFNTTHIYIVEPRKTAYACVHLVVDDDEDEAVLSGLQYGNRCSTNREMRPHKDTLLMLKAGLMYLFRTFPLVKRVSLTDKASIATPAKVMLTAKRLLQGREGWYEEHFGAVPDPSSKATMAVLKALANPVAQSRIQEYLPITTQRAWGTPDDIIDYAYRIAKLETNAILGTSWCIHRDQMKTYEKSISIHILQSGGASLKSCKHRLRRATCRKSLLLLGAYHRRINNHLQIPKDVQQYKA